MPRFVFSLSRPKPLTPAELRLLPAGAVASAGADGVVARAEVDLPITGLFGYAVALGRAVPDALFVAQEAAPSTEPEATEPVPPQAAPPKAASPPPDDVITESDPWKLVDAGNFPHAERVFAAGNELDAKGRERCRSLLASGDPERVALGCRVARLTNWRSIVVNLRPLLRHDHPSVRRDAAEALGALAGPSMASTLKPLLADPDAEVRAAAKAAMDRMG